MEFKEIKEIKNKEEKLPNDFYQKKQYISEPTEEDRNKLVHQNYIFANDYDYNEYKYEDEDSKKIR